jgi:excisionase family DNA binding protein
MTTTAPIPDPRVRPTVSVVEAAALLGISKNYAYELIRAGVFPVRVIRAGTRHKVPTAALLELLGQPQNGDDAPSNLA